MWLKNADKSDLFDFAIYQIISTLSFFGIMSGVFWQHEFYFQPILFAIMVVLTAVTFLGVIVTSLRFQSKL